MYSWIELVIGAFLFPLRKWLFCCIHNSYFGICSTTSIFFKKCSKTEDLTSWNGVSLYFWPLKISFQCTRFSALLEKSLYPSCMDHDLVMSCITIFLSMALLNFLLYQQCPRPNCTNNALLALTGFSLQCHLWDRMPRFLR